MSPLSTIYHGFVAMVLVATWANTLLNLLIVRRIRPSRTRESDLPFVSVLIPARNEEHRIVPCLTSLLEQNYPHYEILMLDDNSEDATRRCAEAIASRSSGHLRIISGATLPEGWTGKSWACHQLAREATGNFLLFTDADTVHEPAMLEAAMAFALHQKASLLSVWPRQVTHSLGEKSVNTLLYLLGIGFFPHLLFWAAQRSECLTALIPNVLFRRMAGANGQFLLFTREAYIAIGGHAAVRAHLVEDVALARRIAARIPAGYRLINADGTLLVRCRMYESLAEVWEGFTKNGRAAFEESIFLFLVFGTILLAAFFLPFVLLVVPETERARTLAEVLAIYGLRMLYAARYRSSWLGAALHPIGLMFAMLIGLNSWRRSASSAGVRWKGRTYKVVHSSST